WPAPGHMPRISTATCSGFFRKIRSMPRGPMQGRGSLMQCAGAAGLSAPPPTRKGSDRLVDPGFQRSFRRSADLVRNDLPVLEQEKRRNTAHAKGGGAFGVLVHVDFDDFHTAFVFGCQLFQRGADLAARPAPF